MAARESDIQIRIRANVGDFDRSMKSAEAAAKVFERELAKMEAQQRAMAAQEAAAYREQAAREKEREQRIRRMARAEAEAYREEERRQKDRQRLLNDVAKAEKDAYHEQQQRDKQRETDLRAMARLEAEAYREEERRQKDRQRLLDEVSKAERDAYREQERRDKEHESQIRQMARIEAEAHRENQRRLEEERRAQERVAEEERQRLQRRRDAMGEVGRAGLVMGAALAAGLALSVRAAVEWESAWTGVTKTVNGTAQEMADLEQSLKDLGGVLPVSGTEIANVAAAAGQLGVAREDVVDFTKTMIDMGVSTNLSSDEAATTLARMMNIMGTAPEDVRRLGSSIVDLGNNFATTEEEIAAMALRIAGAGQTIGLSEADVLGLAAALSSVGIEAEAGGSSVSTILIKMAQAVSQGGDAVAGFAQTANMSVKDFSTLFKTDAAGALVAFEQGLGGVISTGGDAFAVLEDLGITEIRQRDAVLRLANAGDLLSRSVTTSNDAWVENNALTVEATKRYETAASRFQLAKNNINGLAIEIGAELLPMVVNAADTIGGLASAFAALPDEAKSSIAVVGTLGTAILGVTGGAAVAAPALARMTENLVALGRGAAVTRALTATATFLAGPWGVAVAAAAVGIGFLVSKHMDAKKRVDSLTEAIKADSNAIGENTRASKAQQLAQDGTLKTAQSLGLDLAKVNDAYLGNTDALAYLREEYSKAQAAQEAQLRAQQRANGISTAGKEATEGLTVAQAQASAGDLERLQGLQALISGVTDSASETAAAKKEAELYTGAMAAVSAATSETASSLEDLAAGIGLSQEEFEDLTETMAEQIASMVNFGDAYSTVLQRKQEAEQASAEASAKAAGDTSGAWKEAGEDVKVTFEEWLTELEKNAAAQRDYLNNIATLSTRVSADTLANIVAMGPQAATLVQDMVNGSAEQFGRLETLVPLSTAAAMQGAIQQLTAAKPILAQVASQAGQATADALAQELARGEITVDEITKRYGRKFDENIPDIKATQVIMRGVDGALYEVKSVGDAIRALPNEKQIRVSVYDSQGNARSTTVTRNADGTVTTRTDPGKQLKAAGGYISGPGGPREDLIPAMLSNGEYVINAASTAKHRVLVEAINRDEPDLAHFATGGYVSPSNVTVNVPKMSEVAGSVDRELADMAASVTSAYQAMNAADSSEAVTAGQGTAAGGGQGSGWQWQIAALRRAFPGLGLNSAFRPGAKTVSGNSSYHSRGRAVDVPPRMDVFNWLLANYGNSPEIIFSPAGGRQIKNGRPHMYSGAVRAMHFNHVHWAYDQGGVANGQGYMPKLTSAPERVLSPRQTKSFDRLVDLLGTRFADGGIVRSSAAIGTTTGGGMTYRNGADLPGYLARALTPTARATVDDSAVRSADWAVLQWYAAVTEAEEQLAAAKAVDQAATDALRDAESDRSSKASDVTSAARSVASAEEALAKARAKGSPDADRVRELTDDLTEARLEQKTANTALAAADKVLAIEQGKAGVAAADAARKEQTATDIRATYESATEDATKALEAFNAAQAEALAYAQRIAEQARSGSEITGLFSQADVDRALEYAQAAYAASKAEAQAATEASEYQGKIDQLAAAGAALAQAQAASGASYATQKATLASTRTEVEALARAYGFTAEQAQALAASAVPLANTGDTLVGSLERQLTAVVNFSRSVETLRALGLSQGLIDQILAAGPEKGAQVAEELIAGGSDMVKRLNDLERQLLAASNSLGSSAAQAAYGGGTPSYGAGPGLVPLPSTTTTPTISRGVRVTRAGGGIVRGPGGPTGDQIPALLSDREYVLKAAAVQKYGVAYLDDLNALRLAGGGLVGRSVVPNYTRPSAAPQVIVQVTAPAAPATAPHTGPLISIGQVNDPAAMDLLVQRLPTAVGALGLGGGR